MQMRGSKWEFCVLVKGENVIGHYNEIALYLLRQLCQSMASTQEYFVDRVCADRVCSNLLIWVV